ALLAALGAVALLLVLLLAAFGSSTPSFRASLSDEALLTTGRPLPQVIAFREGLRIQLPVSQLEVTAIGYHGADEYALPLTPIGRQANEGIFARAFRRLLGDTGSGVVYYLLDGGSGPRTGALDVGARAGTDVYAPVDGTVVSISRLVLDGRQRASRVDIQPSQAPSVIVSVSRLRVDPALTVGSPVTAATSKIGVVVDLSRVERQALAAYTGEAGNHVTIEVRPAAGVGLR
ncbi:MAG: hypothetical protein C4306_09650, partial [Thermoleophilia bacterium]